MLQSIIGIDLGGTKIEGVVLGGSDYKTVLERKRILTEKEKGYEGILNNIVRLIHEIAESANVPIHRVGIGTPGVIDPVSQLMKNSNTTVLNGRPFQVDLSKKLACPVFMANDANCFALAEARLGIVPDHVPDAQLVIGVIMGTGVGSGIAIHGKSWNGKHGIGGEWGHNFLDESGGPCYCGKSGCVETIIAGSSLERFYYQQSGVQKKLKTIVENRHSDVHATKTVDRLLYFYGKAIGSLINILDPDAIVLGGGVGNIDLLYSEGRDYILPFLFNDRLDTPILKPKLGDSAGVFGAALLNFSNIPS